MDNGLKSFSELLQESYVIPAYQRDYVWSAKDDGSVSTFWDDLIEFHSHGLGKQSSRYLFGPMIVYNDGEKNSVIDGQQRLTTVMIFLCAARDVFTEIAIKDGFTVCNDAITDRNSVTELIGKVYEDPNRCLLKLQLAPANQTYYFTEIILQGDPDKKWGTPPNESTKRMKEAYIFFSSKLKNFVLNDKEYFEHTPEESSKLVSIVTTLTHKFKVFYISTLDLAESYHAFETLNYRGKPLSASDLFKNYAFSRCDPDGKNPEVERVWASIVLQIGSSDITDYIRYTWVSFNPTITKNVLFKKISSSLTTTTEIMKFLRDLDKYAKYYAYCRNPAKIAKVFSNNDLVANIEDMDAMGSLLYYPLLLSMIKAGYSEEDMSRVLDRIVVYTLRNITIPIKKMKVTDHWQRVVSSANEISNTSGQISVRQLIDKFDRPINSDEQFEIDLNAYQSSKKDGKIENSIPKMMLRRAFKHNGYPMPYREFHLEHIYPQKTGKKAEQNWPCFEPVYHDEYCYNLGNMTLLSGPDNESISNGPFSLKKGIIGDSPLCDNKEIAQNEDWTPDTIQERKKMIVQRIIEAWR